MDDTYHLAQINIAHMIDSLDAPPMATFVALLDEINALADGSPGFVWRFKGDPDNAADVRPYNDDRVLFNMSVWSSMETLRAYAYDTAHAAVMRRRSEWFARFEQPNVALWWVRAGTVPSVSHGLARLKYLQTRGPTKYAFTFRTSFSPSPDCILPRDDGKART